MDYNPRRLPVEILKLLLQVAWADDEIVAEELNHIWSVARSYGIAQADVDMLTECLAGSRALPPPDLGFLRAHREKALEAAEAMMQSDRRRSRGEEVVMEQIRQLLGF